MTRQLTFNMRFLLFLVALFASIFCASSVPEIEEEDGSLENIAEDGGVSRSQRFTWRRCDSNYKCPEGYYCKRYWFKYWCYPTQLCSSHINCRKGQYCDFKEGVCKRGERRCSSHYHCSHGQVCLNGKCQNRQCSYDAHCSGDKICVHPGLCQDYKQKCYNQYYCRSGFVCISGWCKKPQCSYNKPCQQGQQCHRPGICKPIPGYCSSSADCSQDKCCLGNRCKPKVTPGGWCLLNPNGRSCPCMPGHFCKRYNYYWGTCAREPTRPPPPPTTAAPPTTEEPGSGSGDFF